jgi:hypothetical protein
MDAAADRPSRRRQPHECILPLQAGRDGDNPTVKPYDEKTWAETVDSRTAPVQASLPVIDGVHKRWVQFLRSLDGASLSRTIMHPSADR